MRILDEIIRAIFACLIIGTLILAAGIGWLMMMLEIFKTKK